ncbi:hypothetical protein L345_03008, partial [Ophiophagus hannah]
MADDLDTLLDEVENKFCRLSRRVCSERLRASQGRKRDRILEKEEEAEAEAAAAGERARFTKILTKGSSEEEDIDEIIKDIDESTYIRNFTTPNFNSGRCCPVYLGGSTAPYGIGTNISQRTCDQLRCTACDFRVLHYNDYQWDKSCDYLFFSSDVEFFPQISPVKIETSLFDFLLLSKNVAPENF